MVIVILAVIIYSIIRLVTYKHSVDVHKDKLNQIIKRKKFQDDIESDNNVGDLPDFSMKSPFQ